MLELRVSSSQDSLSQAKTRHEFVRISRNIPGADEIVGHIVAVGALWVVVSVFSQGASNGWAALPLSEIESVRPEPGGRFVRRGLEHQRRWPARAPRAPLALSEGTKALIVSIASYFPLVTLYAEREDPSYYFVGRPLSSTTDTLRWQEMDLSASWSPEVCEWDISTISRVDFGGQYETALARVAELRGL